MSNNEVFSVNDFLTVIGGIGSGESTIKIKSAVLAANIKFNKWLEEQTTMYGNSLDHLWHKNINCIQDAKFKARIFCFEEIKKCDHSTQLMFYRKGEQSSTQWKCDLCGAHIRPKTWEEI